MRIGLIGCGRVGVTITRLLKSNNRIIGIHDTNKRRQRQAVRLLGIKNNPDYAELVESSEVLLIATPDDIITKAYKQMQEYIY